MTPAGSDDELITTAMLAKELHVTVRACEKWRLYGTGPAFCKIGRKVLYRRQNVREWIEARTCTKTGDVA